MQLLVSNQDVDNYKQIKADLDQLRLTVEKSELWVEKSSSYESGEVGERQVKGGEEPMEVRSQGPPANNPVRWVISRSPFRIVDKDRLGPGGRT